MPRRNKYLEGLNKRQRAAQEEAALRAMGEGHSTNVERPDEPPAQGDHDHLGGGQSGRLFFPQKKRRAPWK